MSLLIALGIDHTLFFQFGVFFITFLGLMFIVFVPYTEAYLKRQQTTTGGESVAEEIAKKAGELRAHYETRAREVSSEVKKIFDTHRDEASKESEKIVTKARSEAQQTIEKTRNKVSLEINEAQKKMKEEIPNLANVIVGKLLSKKV